MADIYVPHQCTTGEGIILFYVRGSVHHKILSITVQRDATISSLFVYFRVTLHASDVVAHIIRST